MKPVLHAGVYVFASLPPGSDVAALDPVVTVREIEGITVIVAEERAAQADLDILLRAAWITLEVPSDLQAVGLTAAFARVLADAGISCNVIAGAYHDHIFVPVASREDAMSALLAL